VFKVIFMTLFNYFLLSGIIWRETAPDVL